MGDLDDGLFKAQKPFHGSLFEKEETNLKAIQHFYMNEDDFDFRLNAVLSSNPNYVRVSCQRNMLLESQLQNGPKCGLVALSIASSQAENSVDADSIFETALSLGFTKQGEMFSADWLAILAEKCCSFEATVLKGGLKKHLSCIVRNLMNKHVILVPYDADFNHSPCLKKGLKAHWAAISGFVIIEEVQNGSDDRDEDPQMCYDCPNSDDLTEESVSAHGGRLTLSYKHQSDVTTMTGKVYLIGKQGKSKHYALWSFEELAESNDNLVSTDRSPKDYILPEGGIVEGLKGKAVVLKRPLCNESVPPFEFS